MPQWVDYKEIKSEIAFTDVLEHYRIELKVKGRQATGFCPLPSHDGNRKSPSFSVNLDRGVFQCFGCGAKGNVIDFIAVMEKLDAKDKRDFHKAALIAQDVFLLKTRPKPTRPASTKASDTRPVRINPPLDFALKGLDKRHPYLAERGFKPKTIERFGLGYCHRGMLKGRIAIPLHDPQGALIGYAGRLADDSLIDKDNPKYKMPATRERDGLVYEFRKSLLLYNGHALAPLLDELIVVEGFPAVWWLWQELRTDAVALMGASCSPEQAQLIIEAVKPDGRIWIMPDGNEAGERCAASLLTQLAPSRFVRWVRLDQDKQPTDYNSSEIKGFLT